MTRTRTQLVHVAGFADLLGMPAVSMEALLSALMQGSSSPLLGLVHVLLLRQAQADMEISHATGCLQVGSRAGWQQDSTQLRCDTLMCSSADGHWNSFLMHLPVFGSTCQCPW